MIKDIVIFIHSCNIENSGTEILDEQIRDLVDSGLVNLVKHIFINNLGKEINPDKYTHISDKIKIINYSYDTGLFENVTLKLLYFYSKVFQSSKILYLHTKGTSYSKDNTRYPVITAWRRFMMYCLTHNYKECVKLLDYVEVVGCNYIDVTAEQVYYFPSHFSGNFWWANSEYISRLEISHLIDKYDSEFWLFRNNPTFANILSLWGTDYDNEYRGYVEEKCVKLLTLVRDISVNTGDLPKIYYGVDGNYRDVTETCKRKCIKDGILTIPAGDTYRAELFNDHIPGTLKHIRIRDIIFDVKDKIRLKVNY